MSAASCVSVLLRVPLSDVAVRTILRVLQVQSKYWTSLRPRTLDPRAYYRQDDAALAAAGEESVLKHTFDLSGMLSLHLGTLLEAQWKLARLPFSKSSDLAAAADSVFVRSGRAWACRRTTRTRR